jgi:hypothetical protein
VVTLQRVWWRILGAGVLTCLSVRAKHLRTISPSRARFSSVLRSSVKYFASRVCPCLLTSSRNLIVMGVAAEVLSPLPQQLLGLTSQICVNEMKLA